MLIDGSPQHGPKVQRVAASALANQDEKLPVV